MAAALSAQAPTQLKGDLFRGSADVGTARAGGDTYDPQSGNYRISGGGRDMWGSADAFHFVWLRLSGDASLTASIVFPDAATANLAKGVLIFRESLDPGSAYADIAIHGDGHTTLQYRALANGDTADVTSAFTHPSTLRIERRGNRFIASVAAAGHAPTAFASTDVPMNEEVYVGLGVCAHGADSLATAIFSDVRVERFARAAGTGL